jgi:hypothetical protein
MIKIKLGELRSNSFKTSLTKLTSSDKLDVKTSYNVMRLAGLLEKRLAQSQKEWIELLAKYVEKDGFQWKLNEEKSDFEYLPGVDKDAAKKAVEEYLAQQVEIDRLKIKLSSLDGVGLSPADLSVLEAIICMEEEV